jgi:hypothetical protein
LSGLIVRLVDFYSKSQPELLFESILKLAGLQLDICA